MERMSWLSKLTPRGVGQRAARSASLQSPVTADPETCLMVFKNHWAQVLRILERRGCTPAPDDLSAVRNNTYQLLNLLAEDRPRGDANAGPILEFVVAENLLERLLGWHLQGDFGEERKVEQLKLYEMLISQARQPLLRHRAVLTPLLRLLSLCAEPTSAPLENSLVLLLNQLCVSVAKEPAILELFFHSHTDQGPANLIIFSLLIPFIHHEGVLGQQARDALLLIMAMSASNHAVAKSITDNSYFCPVLATGLSALYSSLPRKIEVCGDDWHCLRREDWIGVSSLVLFMNSLEFCNAVIQVAHPLVQKQLVDYVHNGFLVPVMGPALHKTSIEEMIASTAYLDLFLRSVSETALLKTFLRFVLLHRHDNATILDTLVSRINSNSRLCMVSLSLFRTLLSLNCEDVMLQLVLRYLLPCSHVMLSQKRAVRDLDIYGKTAAKFLSLIPRCCRPENVPLPERDEEHTAWAKGQSSPSVDASSAAPVPRPSTPSRLAFFMRQQSGGPEAAGTAPRSPGTPSGSPAHRATRWEEVAELDRNYLEYLRDARRSIDRCAWACRVWSAPYDGEEPAAPGTTPDVAPLPDSAPGPPTPRTKKRGLPEEGAGRAPSPSEPHATGPSPDARDSGALVNGAHGHTEPGRPEGDVVVKKVRRSPRGERPAQNGARAQPAGWEPPRSVDSLLEELLAKAPAEPNGAGVSIEAFTQELREIEAEMENGARAEPPAMPEPLLSREEEEAYASFATLPEGEEALGRVRVLDPLAQAVASPPRTVGPPHSQPFTGPFMTVLFGKLENMLHNSLYVNFLLTGLVAQLACYPQPLLRSFLLNTNMVFQPSVKSLLQVLGSVKNKIESFAASQEDFPMLLFKAKKYLIARGKLDWAEAPGVMPALRRSETLARSRKPSLGELILRHTNSPTRARQAAQLALQQVRDGPVLQALAGATLFRGSAEKQSEALRVKNAVYCAVIFSEFLKELAAIAQAHAVTSPFLSEPPEE
ncbi:FHF complex subunit HOOK interacting protein 1B isoform X1 [Gallus gallus]|nr:FHF complex subunit HOOK interacting protein 1B isoform X1 [Gallus gallus]XP_015136427.1 FHF complex subunit HOOK interacting protein 1B isoform X1 [Gallus gallus]XP_040513696.1 FHF complex subunit HOOK interacting protein 1B isoform X1 [Gallus gallus]XP_040513697.1 FHF complex subunit HOOK interacting protein 1B isoform X1 [Gallus gallus]XP_046762902.1 FHF complex subunit HOOK interacting protein 1B isoform X1 [Gallus gallus]XP_046765390.1 FHF complex subunit HOOK interacting protein 1B is|eukprot:XP_015136425.1 FTS and Hook-interacting protein isoform X2 [Gallus gallus]